MSKISERSKRRLELRLKRAPKLRLSLIALSLASVSTAGISAQSAPRDVKGSQDHPMISRVDGSTIKGFDQKEFDEYRLVRGTVSGYDKDGHGFKNAEDGLNEGNSLRLEGKVWRLTYEIPKNRSTLEIIRSYQAELTKAGFRILYQCTNRECGGPLPPNQLAEAHAGALSRLLLNRAGFHVSGNVSNDQRYLAAQLPRADGDVYVSLLAVMVNAPLVRLDVIEVKPLKSNLVSVNAATMATDISTRGSVALYGIYFDTDRAEVKPESRPTLSEIATLLKQNGKLELIVVGHTDNNGSLEHNLDLSLRRAQAVIAALTSEFGVARNRLEARGVGFLAPVAPNTSEENRAKNRRVQLLQR
jgi:outer membrane protein OmpA-like peptidoglycan-associated protein